MKIYGVASSRTRRPLWTAEEAGAEYEFQKINFSAGDHRSEWYLKLNPNGRVPVMEDDGLVIFESAAMCMYIARKYPDAKLLPEPGTRDAALHEQWMYWVVTEPEQALWNLGKHKFALPEEYRIEAMPRTALFEWDRAAKVVAAALEGREFLVGDHLTVADIMLAHTLNWARGFEVPLGSDTLSQYLDRMLERPAFAATKRLE